ncbi:hypothetical protein KIN20_001571 [Parelaphostrongylus tenuis]|uniref:C2H2-type domain-containing protein n=1 Tax=Parelaphostrongylus tenuis TaxID=148309 RepID=A0AAD5LTV2_PARTN|nr:hypothetical protein KIN20_001571 [Parelaphostrongylus tenuis]
MGTLFYSKGQINTPLVQHHASTDDKVHTGTTKVVLRPKSKKSHLRPQPKQKHDKEYLEGQRHEKKKALAEGENNPSLSKSKVSFRCDLYNVTCTGQGTYNAHVRGAKHRKTQILCKKLGNLIPSTKPTIMLPSEMGLVILPPPNAADSASSSNSNVSGKRVLDISTVKSVGGLDCLQQLVSQKR